MLTRHQTWKPIRGGIYLCLKGSKERGTVKGKKYVFDGENLKHFSTRYVTMLLNGYDALRQPGAFEPVEQCPFCNLPMFIEDGQVDHDGYECAQEWDRKVKNY